MRTGLSQQALSKLTGISQQAIHKLESGKSKKTSYVVELAQALQVTPEWLQSGSNQLKMVGAANMGSIAHAMRHPIPVLDWSDPIKWHNAHSKEHFIQDYSPLPNHNAHGLTSYALKVIDDSMTSPMPNSISFREGSYVVVDADKKPYNEDFVVVAMPEPSVAVLRQYITEGDRILLKPLNPHYAVLDMPNDAKVCGVAIEHRIAL